MSRTITISKKALISLLLLSMFATAVIAIVVVTRTMTVSFNIVGVKDFDIYQDAACTIPITSQSWGTLSRGTPYTAATFYIKSKATIPGDNIWFRWGSVDFDYWFGSYRLVNETSGATLSQDFIYLLKPNVVTPVHFEVTPTSSLAEKAYSTNVVFEGLSTSSG